MATKTNLKSKPKEVVNTPVVEVQSVVEPSPNDEAIRAILHARIFTMQENLKTLGIHRDNIAAEIAAMQQGILNSEYLLTKSGLNISDFVPAQS
jgi:hypothetical protein